MAVRTIAQRQEAQRLSNRQIIEKAVDTLSGVLCNLAALLDSNVTAFNVETVTPSTMRLSVAKNNGAPRARTFAVPAPARIVEAPKVRTRKQGASDAIVAALLRPSGVLASELRTIAKYATSEAYLNRLADVHDFTWFQKDENTPKHRFVANRRVQASRRRA